MKKFFCFVITLIIIFGLLSFPAMAVTDPTCDVITYTEYCKDGGYFVVEVGTYVSTARSSNVTGYKTSTYYNSDRVASWSVTVHGSFSYTYGVTAKATSATCEVVRYDQNTEFISKSSYVNGASAIAQATVKCGSLDTYRTVILTCDEYGKLS